MFFESDGIAASIDSSNAELIISMAKIARGVIIR